jgi:hypothetical protein
MLKTMKLMVEITNEGIILVRVFPSSSSLVLMGVASSGSKVLESFSIIIEAGAIRLGTMAGISSKNIVNCLTIKPIIAVVMSTCSPNILAVKSDISESWVKSMNSIKPRGRKTEKIKLTIKVGAQMLLFLITSLISFLKIKRALFISFLLY